MPRVRPWSSCLRITAIALGVALAGSPLQADAQGQRPPSRAATPAPSPAPVAPNAPVSATPQQTTASFADWTLRCTQTGSGPRFCEVVQNIQQNDRPVAQIAVGRPLAGQSLQLTLLVPPNISMQAGPGLLPGSEGEATAAVTLSWRRCLPVGCLADAALSPELVTKVRGWTEPGRVLFMDGAGRPVGLPFSARGLAQALDALAKEEGAG